MEQTQVWLRAELQARIASDQRKVQTRNSTNFGYCGALFNVAHLIILKKLRYEIEFSYFYSTICPNELSI